MECSTTTNRYTVYATNNCSKCAQVKNILHQNKIEFDIINVSEDKKAMLNARKKGVNSGGTIWDKEQEKIVTIAEVLETVE